MTFDLIYRCVIPLPIDVHEYSWTIAALLSLYMLQHTGKKGYILKCQQHNYYYSHLAIIKLVLLSRALTYLTCLYKLLI